MSGNSSDAPAFPCTSNDYIFSGGQALRFPLLLPLCCLLLHSGVRRWRQQRSFNSSPHSDIFAYHLAAMELVWVLGYPVCTAGFLANAPMLRSIAWTFCNVTFFGELCFYVLTCTECYLAVVHPISYRNSRSARGTVIRDATIAGVWLLCGAMAITTSSTDMNTGNFLTLCFAVVCIIVMTVCSLSALCVVIRPGPGEGGGGHRTTADKSKRRAFQTILVISAAVWLWFVALIVSTAVMQLPRQRVSVRCAVLSSLSWFNLPTCLVSPLLYLHREGKFRCLRAFRRPTDQ